MNPSWRRYLRFWGARVEEDVDDELAFHLEMRAHEYMNRGMREDDAYELAMRRIGDLARAKAACRTIGHRRQRRMQRTQTIDALVQDVRYALRTLGRQRAWTAVALITMALGIGASTAMFSVVNSTVLNPLPYRDADRIVMIWRFEPKSKIMLSPSDRMLAAWQKESHAFENIEVYGAQDATLTGRGDATKVGTAVIQPTFPAFTGSRLIAGRSFAPEELQPGGPKVAIISEQLWRQQFAGAKDVIGQTITLNDKPTTIIGVAPSSMRLPMVETVPTDVWLPRVKDTAFVGNLTVGRLRKGVSVNEGAKELTDINARDHLTENVGSNDFKLQLVRPADVISFKSSLYLLAGAVALLMIVACANVAHLLLARGATRERELAIRTALGAGRGRLVRQLLTESLLLAGVGCIGGIAIGYVGVRVLASVRPDRLAALARTHLDLRALGVAIAISAFAGLAFGLTAAFHAIRRTTADSLRGTTTSGTGAPPAHRLRSLLVMTEMAMSAMLLVGAALVTRSVAKLQQIDPGFDAHDLYSASIRLPRNRYPLGEQRMEFMRRVADRARMIPGVTSVGLASATPPEIGGFMMAPLQIEGSTANDAPSAVIDDFVDPGFFKTIGIRMEGAGFGPNAIAANEIVINRSFAEKYWPGTSAVGHRVRYGGGPKQKPDEDWMTIVGVANDVSTGSLSIGPGKPYFFSPIEPKSSPSQWSLAIRTDGRIDPSTAVRKIVTSLDSKLVPPAVGTVDADLAATIAPQRFTMVLLAVFAGLAVVLSAVGLYGVISYVVTQRTREIGIRIALGATPRRVARAVVAKGLVLSVVGLSIGLGLAVWGSALIKSVLYGVTGTDPLSYAFAGIALLAVSVLACTIPMRRAMRVDPVIAMRAD